MTYPYGWNGKAVDVAVTARYRQGGARDGARRSGLFVSRLWLLARR